MRLNTITGTPSFSCWSPPPAPAPSGGRGGDSGGTLLEDRNCAITSINAICFCTFNIASVLEVASHCDEQSLMSIVLIMKPWATILQKRKHLLQSATMNLILSSIVCLQCCVDSCHYKSQNKTLETIDARHRTNTDICCAPVPVLALGIMKLKLAANASNVFRIQDI